VNLDFCFETCYAGGKGITINLPQEEFTVFSVEVSGPTQTIDGNNSDQFEVEVRPTTVNITAYQWIWEIAPGDVGNNPNVNFSTPNQQTTNVRNARWYARPNNRLASVTGLDCEYIINCNVTVGGNTYNDPTPPTWRVYLPSPVTTTSWPRIVGMCDIVTRIENGTTIWYVASMGTLRRTNPVVTSYIPLTSQFYHKYVIVHEGRHVQQWTAMDPWQNLFDANALYNNTLINLTSTVSRADLEQQIRNEIDDQNDIDDIIAALTSIDREQDAYNQSKCSTTRLFRS
jgi:hypothetical protein